MITKQDAAILFAYGFKLVDKEGNRHEIACVNYKGMVLKNADLPVGDSIVLFNQIGTDYWILKRPYSQLTKSIVVEGKEIIPIVELAKRFHTPSEAAIFKYDNIIDAGSYGVQVSCYLDHERHSYYSVYPDADLFHYNDYREVEFMHSLHFINLPEGTYREMD